MSAGRTARRAGLASFVLALSSIAAPATAHLGHIVVSAERYLKLDASEADTRLVVSLTLGETEGRRVLAAADVDHDRTVTQAESDAYLAEWGRGLREELRVEIDGTQVPVSFGEPFLDPIGPVASVPVSAEMVAHLPVTTRDASIVVSDRMVRRDTYDRTEVAFRGHDGAQVIVSGAGRAPSQRELDLAFGPSAGEPMPDEISMRVRYPERPEPTPPWAWPVAGGALVTAATAGWLARRRREK
ncbi:MAG: hypothetical protein K1X94_15125 [Sandaracinaceae bacterium]|nr:hypothetical protein [Sandaracinaceae bacterium]